MPCSVCDKWVQNPVWVPVDGPSWRGAWQDSEGRFWVTKCPSCRFHSLIVALRFLREALEEDLALNWTSSLQEIHDTANLALQEAEYLATACEAHLQYLASIPRRISKPKPWHLHPWRRCISSQVPPAEPLFYEPRGGKGGKGGKTAKGRGKTGKAQAKKGSHQT